MITKLLQLFKKKDKPNLKRAYQMLGNQREEFDNILFYMSQIEDFQLTVEQKLFMNRTAFNLESFRDEIQIEYNNRRDKRNYERLANRSK